MKILKKSYEIILYRNLKMRANSERKQRRETEGVISSYILETNINTYDVLITLCNP